MMEAPGSKENVEHYHAEKTNLVGKLLGSGNRSCPFQLRAGKAGGARASWRIHAGWHAPRGSKRRDARFESGFECSLRYIARGPDEFTGEYGPHENAAAPDLIWAVPFEGWLLAYHPRLADSNGNTIPGTTLHHTAFWNENRADFLCPNKEEHIFGAGSEMTDWAELPGYGYHVQKGDKIRIETMMYNPTATSYDKVYLEVQIPFVDANGPSVGKMIRNVYPAWMDVASCGNSGYDLPAGKSTKSGTVTVKYDGVLLGVGGHLHDYGRQVVLQDSSRKETVATLDTKVDGEGRLKSVPVKLFLQEGGYKFSANDVLKISAAYNNPTGKLLRDGAMGIAVGYFVPANDKAMAALRRKAKPAHDMAAMSHDH